MLYFNRTVLGAEWKFGLYLSFPVTTDSTLTYAIELW